MKLLLLYGVNCTKEIWDYINPYFLDFEVDYVEYPHEVTAKANNVEDLTKWVYDTYHLIKYDVIIGHSLGGIIALQLAANYNMEFSKIIFLDTNLKPAEAFYRNLMTLENMEKYGNILSQMFDKERFFYRQELFKALQAEFDYTALLDNITQKIFGIYGDRGIPEYANRIHDLNLSDQSLERVNLIFIANACHMPMVENPQELSQVIHHIVRDA